MQIDSSNDERKPGVCVWIKYIWKEIAILRNNIEWV